MKVKLILLLGFLGLISCSGRRVDLIEETFGIKLPQEYDIVNNTTESSGFAGADFEVNIQLKFQKASFDQLNQELKKIDYLKQRNAYSKDLKNETAILELDSINRELKFRFVHI